MVAGHGLMKRRRRPKPQNKPYVDTSSYHIFVLIPAHLSHGATLPGDHPPLHSHPRHFSPPCHFFAPTAAPTTTLQPKTHADEDQRRDEIDADEDQIHADEDQRRDEISAGVGIEGTGSPGKSHSLAAPQAELKPGKSPPKSKANAGKKLGVLFLSIAASLQVAIIGFLGFRMWQISKIKDWEFAF
ncbi:hypothetical protein ACLOJK_006998 [Asimina triloba]